MVFSSLVFLFMFFPLSLAIYFLSPRIPYRNIVLIIFSLAFYAWGEPVWVTILLFSTFIDYVHGLIAEAYRGQWQSKAALASSIVINLTLLGFFKYSGFFVENLNALLGTTVSWQGYGLPIGISFYTFQTISYVYDVYRGEVKAQRSLLKLLLFVSLFHQLVAGPIVRYKDIASEIVHRSISWAGFNEGLRRFAVGLGKKVVLANSAGDVARVFMDGSLNELSVLGAWFGVTLFAFQIYFDFSGYSDMAIGLGKMIGFTYLENFNYPYIARSVADFWRRWHISLGSFFRDYLYIPLGGNRKHVLRNLFVVWFLTGLWHGASWNFVLWGLVQGVFIAAERLGLDKLLMRLPRAFSHLYLLTVVLVGWVLFYFTDLSLAFTFLRVMFALNGQPLTNLTLSIHVASNALFLLVAVVACTPQTKIVHTWLSQEKNPERLSPAFVYREVFTPLLTLALFTLSTALLIGQSYNPFLYFRF